jgi:hypothetical protein
MSEFIHGALTLGYLVAALFFVRFWRASHDRLFVFFAIAFTVLALNRFDVSVRGITEEIGTPFYWIRLIAYLIILAGIVDKNVRRSPSA